MRGESILAKILLVFVLSGALETRGLKSEETADVPSLSYEEGYVKPDRLGGAPWAHSSPRAAHARTTIAHSSTVADKSAEWIVALRSSLMRDNYDYQPPAPEALVQVNDDGYEHPNKDTTGETGETSDASGETSGGDQNGRPSAQDYDRPTPRSLNHSPSTDQSFSRARPFNPTLKPSRPVHQNISRKNMYRDVGLELPTIPVPESPGRSARRQPRGRALASLTMPPRTAQNAALLDEINEQFEAKRRNYLESLYELEDQLKPVYAGGGRPGADRRGGGDRGGRNIDDGIGIKSDSLPYIGHNGIRRYKVFKNEIEKLQPFVEDYLDYRNNHPEARVDAELIPWHNPQKENQDPMTELHQEALKMTDNVKPTFEESSEHVKHRKPQRKDRFEQRSGRKGTTKGDQRNKNHHRRKKQRSMYLESAELPDIGSEDFGQRYNSRRNAEAVEDSSDLLRSPSPTGLPSTTSST